VSDARLAELIRVYTPHPELRRPGDDDLVACLRELQTRREQAWQPIASASRDTVTLFWVVPKDANEAPRNTSGDPIVSKHEPYMFRGKFGGWGALSKAVAWRPLLLPPAGETED